MIRVSRRTDPPPLPIPVRLPEEYSLPVVIGLWPPLRPNSPGLKTAQYGVSASHSQHKEGEVKAGGFAGWWWWGRNIHESDRLEGRDDGLETGQILQLDLELPFCCVWYERNNPGLFCRGGTKRISKNKSRFFDFFCSYFLFASGAH